jgi:hypothetical protein
METGMMDTSYRDKIALAVWKAILETSASDVFGAGEKRIVAIQSGEAVDALIRVMGILMSTSEATSTPAKLRDSCDQVARRLRAWTTSVREDGSAWSIFDRVVEGTMQ